eukprot:NODE_784_length_4268_cov_0.314628.p2 type:complete len:321 gc:universal NODE_784_length_4268_cov_0.314628:3001-3963(+)
MVEAYILKSTSQGFIGGIDEPAPVVLEKVKSKDVVLISDPLQEQQLMEDILNISASSKCSKLGLLLSPVSALYGVNETTGLVVDLNETGLYFSVVFEGKYLPYCSLRVRYTLDDLYRHFKSSILPTIKCKKNLMGLSDSHKFDFFKILLKESVPNDERDCVFIAIEQDAYENNIQFNNEELEIFIPSKQRSFLFKDLIENQDFISQLNYTIQRIPNRIRNTLSSHILLSGPFLIQDFESVIRTGLLKYMCISDKVNENQICAIAFVNRLAIDHMEVARELGLLWFAGGQVSRKYVIQDEKYHLTGSDYNNNNAILNKLYN